MFSNTLSTNYTLNMTDFKEFGKQGTAETDKK